MRLVGPWRLWMLSTMIGSAAAFGRPARFVRGSISRRTAVAAFSSSLVDRRVPASRIQQSRQLHQVIISPAPERHCRARRGSTRLQAFFSTSNDDGETTNGDTKSQQPQQPLLLDPKAPLRPLLSDHCNENHLSAYTLPPTTLGEDDYRPDLKKGQRVVAFGDVHGDIDALREFLIAAEVLDPDSSNEEPMWSGGETICVQTGDVLDRGDDELACFRLLATLSRQAKQAGGALILLYGNHESLNAAGLFQYANPGGNVEFEKTIGARIDYNYGSNRWRLQFAGNEPSRWASFEPGGLLAENMLGNMLVACVMGRTVFVHAGLMAGHLRSGANGDVVNGNEGERTYGGISKLNEEAREWITNGELFWSDGKAKRPRPPTAGFMQFPFSHTISQPTTETTITGENTIRSRRSSPRRRIGPRSRRRRCRTAWGAASARVRLCG